MRQVISTLTLILVILSLTGCPKNPASLGKAEVEAMLKDKDKLDLKSITLDAKPQGGGYSGTGQGTDGTEYKIDVVQDPKESKLSYTAESQGGDILSGHIMHK